MWGVLAGVAIAAAGILGWLFAGRKAKAMANPQASAFDAAEKAAAEDAERRAEVAQAIAAEEATAVGKVVAEAAPKATADQGNLQGQADQVSEILGLGKRS